MYEQGFGELFLVVFYVNEWIYISKSEEDNSNCY